ncbi:hypothetical protein JCM12178A_14440 [Salidesulfovibrio brasiliensis]
MGGDKRADRKEVEPEKFEKNGHGHAGLEPSGHQRPEQADHQWTLKEPDAYRASEERKQGKKKATTANQMNGDAIMTGTSPVRDRWGRSENRGKRLS